MSTAPDSEAISESGAWLPNEITVPRMAAVERLVESLTARGMSPSAAQAVAVAAARPDQVRRRLNETVEVRVPGGTLLVVETIVWTPAISVFPTNPREMAERIYPLGLPAGEEGMLLDEPVQTRGHTAELTLTVAQPKQLADRLRNAEQWLTKQNPLAADIAVDGILQAVTLVPLNVRHRDRSDPVTLLSAADGSSRTSAAHAMLGLDAGRLAYQTSAREIRQLISRVLRVPSEADADEESWGRLRAVTAPARIVVGYREDVQRGVPFHNAVRALIGLTHIRPPRAYGRPVERDALGDVVLDTLATRGRRSGPVLSPEERDWFSGRLTPSQRDAAGLPTAPDVRAAAIVWKVIAGDYRTTVRVNDGIRGLTGEQSPGRNLRVDVAVELILRTVRSEHARDKNYSLITRRAALQRAYRLPELHRLQSLQEGVLGAPLSLPQLRNEALRELGEPREDNRLRPAQTELAVKAAYYMVTAKEPALRRELLGRDDDDDADERALSVVLRAMLNSSRGIRQAYAVVKAGRARQRLLEVDDVGGPTRDESGARITLTDALVRATYIAGSPIGVPAIGAAAAGAAWERLTKAIDGLQEAVDAMSSVPDESGAPFVETHGWNIEDVAQQRERLDDLDRTIADWRDVRRRQDRDGS